MNHRVINSFSLHAQRKKIDWFLFLAAIAICLFGLVFIFEASSVAAARDFGNKYYFVKDQLVWFGLGVILMIFVSFFDYHQLYKLALPTMLVAILLLLLVYVPGLGVKVLGARRWLNFAGFTLQPAEAAKLALIIYLSAWFSLKEKGRLPAFVILVGLVVGLIIAEPDLGTAVVICLTSLVLYFVSGAPISHFFMLVPAGLVSILGLAITSSYRLRRLTTYLKPSEDPLGASYHIRQVLLALGSGGIFGLGLGKSRQKFEYLPEAMTDSIFAIIAEEIGFLGALCLIGLFLFIIFRGIKTAFLAPDRFGQLLAFGISSWLGVQTLINLGAMVAIIPLTGVPLPFISYGGSSLVVNLVGIGIILNISKQCLAR